MSFLYVSVSLASRAQCGEGYGADSEWWALRVGISLSLASVNADRRRSKEKQDRLMGARRSLDEVQSQELSRCYPAVQVSQGRSGLSHTWQVKVPFPEARSRP